MTRLSVNINKIATIRNARGGKMPDVAHAAVMCEKFGAEGITVHPRPDERHIRYSDVRQIRPLITTDFNIEGNPIPSFIDLVLEVVPDQVTLVPDAEDAITSNSGWDCIRHKEFLTDVCKTFKDKGIRTSIFIDPIPGMARAAAECGCDRVELYTEPYASGYPADRDAAIDDFIIRTPIPGMLCCFPLLSISVPLLPAKGHQSLSVIDALSSHYFYFSNYSVTNFTIHQEDQIF